MAAIDDARRLARAGRFGEAATALDSGRLTAAERTASRVFRVELLERLGEYSQAKIGANELLQSPKLTPLERSACWSVIGRLESLTGHFDDAIRWYQKAVSLAEYHRAYEQAFWPGCRLLMLVSDHSGSEAAASLLSEIRANATRTGDPLAMAALHCYVAQIEAKRGSLVDAGRHVRLALGLFRIAPNAWLESVTF